MENSAHRISVDYFSDVLCVWAWIAQPRLEELKQQWGDRVHVSHRFVDIFGDCLKKIPQQWGEEDGYEKFNAHITHSAASFEQAGIHPDTWTHVKPQSSMQSHLVLKAAGIAAGADALDALALRIRKAFFTEARDVGKIDELVELAGEVGVGKPALLDALNSGAAMAALSRDLRIAKDTGVKGSPTWVLNEGRQVLYGNVGYRILNANIEELLKHPTDETSWC